MQVELLSVHVPKCAGTALLHALERRYGTAQVKRDYDQSLDDPAAEINLDPFGYYKRADKIVRSSQDVKIVHGHFNPQKYRSAKPKWVITFLREPVERIVSHYSHWLAMPSIGHRLHEYVLRERLNLEEFARLPALRYLYSRLFFADVSTREITVCGFHDSFNADLAKIKRLTDYDFDVLEENVNSSSSYRSMQDNLLADAALTRNLRDILIEDTRFYDNMRTRSVAVQ